MENKIYCIKDVKSGFNLTLMLFANDEVAIRYFKAISQDESSLLFKCKEDFELWRVGKFNSTTGAIVSDLDFVFSMVGGASREV